MRPSTSQSDQENEGRFQLNWRRLPLWFWLILTLLALGLNVWFYTPHEAQPADLPYSTFLEQVRAGNVAQVEMDDFQEALDKIVLGAERTLLMDERERRTVAYHEAGHALLASLLPGADPVRRVTIIPRGRTLGVTAQLPEEERYNYSRDDLLMGLGATSLGFGGMFLAGGIVSPGLAAVLANVQPLIAAGLAYLVLSERLGPRRRVGLLLGFAGIILIALPSSGAENANSSPLGVGYVLLGALGVAVGNVLLKRLAGQVDLLMATGWQFILGGVPLFLAAQIFEVPVQVAWSPSFVVVLLALALLGTALAFTLWFSLLHRGELTRLNTFTFLTPVFALIIGALFFAESLRLVEMGGIVLTLAGALRVSRR